MVVAMTATIKQAYESYLRTERCMRERSVRDYLDAFSLLASKLDLLEVSSYKEINDRLKAIKEERRYSQGSIYKFSVCVKHIFRWLQREQYRPDNPYPFSDWKKARPSTPKFLIEGQFQAIIDSPHLSHQEACLLWLLWDSGARIGEVAALRRENIDLEKGIVNIPYEISKGNYSFRYVPISKTCVWYLTLQAEKLNRRGITDVWFINSQNQPMTVSGLQKVVNNIGLRGNHPTRLSPHAFRHSCGIRWLEAGVPEVIVQKWLGHQTLQMTSRYVNLCADSSKKIFDQFLETAGKA